MNYNTISKEIIEAFISICGTENVLTESIDKKPFGKDHTEDLEYLPELVLIPKNAQEISEICKICNQNLIPITSRGAGTGLSGGCLPVKGGLVLSLVRLNKILKIDTENYQAIVEPGVINEVLQTEVQKLGLFYPPDPASKGSCTLGGNVAHSSGGPRCVKYGTTRDYVLNLEIVLANGEIIETGANVLKNSTGYNLTQLMVGSEGTLGITTKITLKLLPYPPFRALMLAYFFDAKSACATVPLIFQNGVQPSAMEFMDKKGVSLSCKYKSIDFDLKTANAFLLIEVDAFSEQDLMPQCEKIYEVLEQNNAIEVLMAEDNATIEKLWNIRRSIGEVAKMQSTYKEEDTVVTRSFLPNLYEETLALCALHGLETICYGHAGDGNLHINILKNDLSDAFWNNELPKIIRQIFEICKKYGGTISGEHGIGWVQKPYLDIVFQFAHFEIMRGIKKAFDPKGILNPEKIF